MTIGITSGAFKWGLHYTRNTPFQQVLSIVPERNLRITNEYDRVINNATNSVALTIWHSGYLYARSSDASKGEVQSINKW